MIDGFGSCGWLRAWPVFGWSQCRAVDPSSVDVWWIRHPPSRHVTSESSLFLDVVKLPCQAICNALATAHRARIILFTCQRYELPGSYRRIPGFESHLPQRFGEGQDFNEFSCNVGSLKAFVQERRRPIHHTRIDWTQGRWI